MLPDRYQVNHNGSVRGSSLKGRLAIFNDRARGSSSCDVRKIRGTQNAFSTAPMDADVLSEPSPTVADAESWLALGTGALLLLVGTSRRSLAGACLAVSSAPLLYRGITGRWPHVLNGSDQ